MYNQLNEALIKLKLENYNSSSNLNMVLDVITTREPKTKVISLSPHIMEAEKDNFVKYFINSTLNVFKRKHSA